MKTIIAATNFSEAADHAVAFAADMAKGLGAQLIIFNALDILPAAGDGGFSSNAFASLLEQANRKLGELEEEMKARTENAIKIKSECRIGSVVMQLEMLCDEENPFAVVVAPQLSDFLDQLATGVHGVPITKNSSFPVIVVPPGATLAGFGKVAIAINLANDQGIQWLFLNNWLKAYTPKLDIVTISSRADGAPEEVPALLELGERLSNFKLGYHFLVNGDVEEGIRSYIEEKSPDLLIMFVQKHGLFHKSITKPFVKNPPVPVMFISPQLKEETSSLN